MLKIKNCKCACCGGDEVSFMFITNNYGSLETNSDFIVREVLDDSPFKPKHQLTASELTMLMQDCVLVDVLCMTCINECERISIEVEDGVEELFDGMDGKSILRYVLADSVPSDTPMWTIEDLEHFMVTPARTSKSLKVIKES